MKGESKEEDVALEDDEEEEENYCKLPKWLYKYLVFRFNLLDRLQDILTPDFSTLSFNSGLLIPSVPEFSSMNSLLIHLGFQ